MQGNQNAKKIEFYRGQGAFGYLSNFYPSPFTVNNFIYPTNQHFFQSRKYQGKQMERIIVEAESPAEAFRLGRTANVPLREDWEEVKEQIMYEGLINKFTQNKELKIKLLDTKESKLIEHTKKDKFWADGGNGSGQNRLGILLMRVRDQLREEKF